MYREKFYFIFLLIINFNLTVFVHNNVIEVKSLRQTNINSNLNVERNETDFSQNISNNSTGNLFWVTDNEGGKTVTDIAFENSTETLDQLTNNEYSEEVIDVTSTNIPNLEVIQPANDEIIKDDMWFYPKMNEKITLQRNNCYLEIDVKNDYDIKTQISFGKLESNSTGNCCITLNGQKNNKLGVWISNIHLYHNASEEEILKVFTAEYGYNFLLKQYNSWNNYQPLLLTETHKVYIVLHYNVTEVSVDKQDSYFNLEVFSYYK